MNIEIEQYAGEIGREWKPRGNTFCESNLGGFAGTVSI